MLENLGKTDIYLIDQIMQNRVTPEMRILDAGCGWGRNSEIFVKNDYQIWGIDNSEDAIRELHGLLPSWNKAYNKARFSVADLDEIPFPDEHFDFIISSVVLHFCESRTQFVAQFKELIRVLAPEGILWLRMTAKHTIEDYAKHLHDDIYMLPDGSTRYLLDRNVLQSLMDNHGLYLVDHFKTVNISDIRTMATVVLSKE